MIGWIESSRGAAVIFALVLLTSLATLAFLHPISVKIRRRGHKPRSGTVEVLHNPANAKFEIVAVHGLAADPDYTWTQAVPAVLIDRNQDSKAASPERGHQPGRIHLLRDLLPRAFPEARILSFAHNSKWLTDASVKTTEEIGKNLLEEIKAKRSQQHLPIIFIGHSLGGIIVKHALCIDGFQGIINDTSGVIFLGTPHQGSSISAAAAALAFVTGFLGSDATLLLSLRNDEAQLSDLGDRFQECIAPNKRRRQKIQIISFYETMPTYLLGWLSIGLVVSRNSAVVHADERYPIDTDHSGLNKCARLDDGHFLELRKAIEKLRAPSWLEQADNWIQSHYTTEKLRVERLSGKELRLDECYINLTILEQRGENADRSEKGSKEAGLAPQLSPFSVDARQKDETVDETIQVELEKIFNEREESKRKQIHPRRILIRGHAGVGKTTMCKKIVHNFIYQKMWQGLFKRVLWVPLRNLKGRDTVGYNLANLFYDEYFCQHPQGDGLADELWRELNDTKSESTLFILDGLDELSDFKIDILTKLLNQPNVIITSRPNAGIPSLQDLGLELEAVGFNSDQVKDYVEKAFVNPKTGKTDKKTADEIHSFLRDQWVLQGLVQIPILLEALCYTWEGLDHGAMLDTMTGIYKAIVQKLWKKDAEGLEKKIAIHKQWAHPIEIRRSVESEITLLECLAFSGLYSDIIDFTEAHRGIMATEFELNLPLDKTLGRLSFIRTSDASARSEVRNYHFLHLTFQEFFAAQYFVRHWKQKKELEYVFTTQSDGLADPFKFLQRHKYSARYNIFWRFVAGLLDADGRASPLVDLIETEPLDMLGPTHQRLVMHCLGEISSNLPARESIEKRLSKWILFEWKYNNSAHLANEVDCPEQALATAFRAGSENIRREIFLSLIRRGKGSPSIFEQAACLLKDGNVYFRRTAIEAISCRSNLHETLLEAVAARLGDEDTLVREAAIKALSNQSNLPKEFLEAVAARLEDEDRDVRRAAIDTLSSRSNLPEGLRDAVMARLKEEDRDIGEGTIDALSSSSNWSEGLIEAVVARLGDKNRLVRRATIKALSSKSSWPEGILEAVAARLGDKDTFVQQAAIKALSSQSNLPKEVLKVVAARVEDEDSWVREAAIRVLSSRSNLHEKLQEAVATQLEDKDILVRRAAIDAVSNQSNLPRGLFDAVAARLRDKDRVIREAAIKTLSSRSNWPEGLVETVAAQLGDKNSWVREAASRALSSRSNLHEKLREAVATRLEDKDMLVGRAAIYAVSNQSISKEFLEAMTAQLVDEDRGVRRGTIYSLSSHLNLPEALLKAVAARLGDEDWSVQEAAIDVLSSRSKWPEGLIEAVVALLEDELMGVRRAAINSLKSQLDLPEKFLKAVAARLRDDEINVQEIAIGVLSSQSNLPEALLETLLEFLVARFRDKDRWVREAAIGALSSRSSWPERLLEAVAARLGDEHWSVRKAAIDALSRQSNLPVGVLDAVASRFGDEDLWVREAAVRALSCQSNLPEALLEAVAARLENQDWSVREAAIEALSSQSHWPEGLIEAVMARLGSEDWPVRKAAIKALNSQSNLPEALLKAVAARLGDEDCSVREAAIDALSSRSNWSESLIEAVMARLGSEDGDVRKAAIDALSSRSNWSEGLIEAVMARLGSESRDVRKAAIRALSSQSNWPEALIEAAAARLGDEDWSVREVVIKALSSQSNLPKGFLETAINAVSSRSNLPNAFLMVVVAQLEDKNRDVREAAINALSSRPNLPDEILEAVAARLESTDWDVRQAAIDTLSSRSNLPEGILEGMTTRLRNEDIWVRRAAIKALSSQSNWPGWLLEALAARLKDEGFDVQQAAEVLLRRHEEFYFSLFSTSYATSLYKILLLRSFREQVSWYTSDGNSYVSMADSTGRVSILNQENDVTAMINKERPKGLPSIGVER